MNYTLIVKGDADATLAALRDHGIAFTMITRHEHFNECIVVVPASTDTAMLNKWFCEPIDVPALPGTLLWWGERRSEPHIVPKGWTEVEAGVENAR